MKRTLLQLAIPVAVGVLCIGLWIISRPKSVFYGSGEIRHLVFSNDGRTLLVSQVEKPRSLLATKLTALNFAPDFTTKWSYEDGDQLGKPQFFSSDSRILVDRGFLRTFDAATGKLLRNGGTLRKAAISPDGKWLAYRGQDPSNMGCLPPQTISQQELCLESPLGAQEGVSRKILQEQSVPNSFSFSPDSQNLVVAGSQRRGSRLDFYDVNTWKLKRRITDFPRHGIQAMEWSRNGRFLLSITCFFSARIPDAYLNLWRVSDAKLLSSLTVPCGEEPYDINTRFILPSFEVQNDGRVLRFGIDNQVLLSNSSNLSGGFQQLMSLPADKITAASISPDSRYLVAGTKSGQVIRRLLK
ncbi:WD40 repeat domain-containing protein [bacterium]|nr:MAG: WD40 repeat domain-containing protein [bacterium]